MLFADDISVLITANNLKDLQMRFSSILNYMSKCFAANGWSLNIDKTDAIKFNLSHSQGDSFRIPYKNKEIKQITNMKFLGLEIDQRLN
jgi:hypothetical protein